MFWPRLPLPAPTPTSFAFTPAVRIPYFTLLLPLSINLLPTKAYLISGVLYSPQPNHSLLALALLSLSQLFFPYSYPNLAFKFKPLQQSPNHSPPYPSTISFACPCPNFLSPNQTSSIPSARPSCPSLAPALHFLTPVLRPRHNPTPIASQCL
ncbi:hypothetical protein Pmani_001560 [Petrolisthes manimaculis]|uniref:Uncharacterized protein n=1 Tax=Petrolisthes manimaculis TaxID=1843537 RepID=A0AAE1QLZ2_9EUCA|nr:hypothetical protein Pmani_001560 [Petrolisthes manimaculis]